MARAPRLATWLLRLVRPGNDPAVGDLLEQFCAGKSARWYRRQALLIIVTTGARELRAQSLVLAIAGVFSFAIALMTYAAFQQPYRHAADYPQIDMAAEAAYALNHGARVEDIVPPQAIDMRHSLAPYVMVFDDAGNPVQGSARLDGRIPIPPADAFGFARRNAPEHRFTWEPVGGVRTAAVLRHYGGPDSGGFVLVGRSLRDVESRIASTTRLVVRFWVGSLLLLLAGFAMRSRWARA